MSMPHPFDLEQDPPPLRVRRTKPRFQLRLSAVFWRVAIVTFLVMEVVLWLKWIRRRVPFRPRHHRILLMLYFTPGLALRAAAIGLASALVTDFVFRVFVRPLMVRWYHPGGPNPGEAHAVHFRLGAGEVIEQELPARRMVGRKAEPGVLVRTNQRIHFEPGAWDGEPWSVRRADVAEVSTFTPRRRVLGWVRGYPDHVVIRERSEQCTTIVVADPADVLVWFAPKASRAVELQTAW